MNVNIKAVKGYFLTILSGLVVFAGVLFVVLQWGVTSTVSIYGKPVSDVPTGWVVVASAVGGPVFMVAVYLLFRGAWLLYVVRRDAARLLDASIVARDQYEQGLQAPEGQRGEAVEQAKAPPTDDEASD